MRTSDALSPMPGLVVPLIVFTILYLFLAAIVVWLMVGHIAASPTVSYNVNEVQGNVGR
jgi:cytochrome d ubiquinol oxidase subunit I